MSKITLGIVAGVAGSIFLGYCIYFDTKRRSDPDYKKKIRERRKRIHKDVYPVRNEIPNLYDHESVERYFLQEIQMGEVFITKGDFESGAEHLANALVICSQPARLLQVLQTTLPSQVFAMLILKMQEFGKRSTSVCNETENMILANALGSDISAGTNENFSIDVIIDDLE